MIWKDIPNFDGYQASSEGDIRSKDRVIKQGRFYPYCGYKEITIKVKSKTLKQQHNPNGYMQVNIYSDSKSITKLVHLLVADAFIGRKEGFQVNHINGNKKDNSLDNLEVVTPSQNILHAEKSGLIKRENGRFVKVS